MAVSNFDGSKELKNLRISEKKYWSQQGRALRQELLHLNLSMTPCSQTERMKMTESPRSQILIVPSSQVQKLQMTLLQR